MVESVDTRDLKSLGRKAVRVQVPLRVQRRTEETESLCCGLSLFLYGKPLSGDGSGELFGEIETLKSGIHAKK